MLLGLSQIIDCPGGVVPFETTLDLSDMVIGGSRPFPSPIEARGQVRNTAGVLLLTAEIRAVLDGVCDRCCKSFRRDFTLPLEAVLVTKLESDALDDPWTFELVGDEADLDDVLTTAVVLNLDSQLLCKPDCKGLCARCGKDLNEGPCSCQPERDPRLQVLEKLLNK